MLNRLKNKSVGFVKICTFLFATSLIVSCTSAIRFSSTTAINSNGGYNSKEIESSGDIFIGKASYYGNEFNGRKTANGETYDQNKLTVAHRSLPFGTILKVRNLTNNREVLVKVNDRGPFVSGRIIDLSYRAAVELDMIRAGVIDVEIIVVDQ